MLCETCKTDRAAAVRYTVNSGWGCDICSGVSIYTVPDVYFDGNSDQGLYHDNGKPIQFLSKGHKAQYMKDNSIVEAGDRIRGSLKRDNPSVDRKKTREEVHEAVQKAKAQMRGYRNSHVA